MSNNKITFTNGSVIIPIKSNGDVIRGKRREVIDDDIKDISDYISKEELDKILAPFIIKNADDNLDSIGGI